MKVFLIYVACAVVPAVPILMRFSCNVALARPGGTCYEPAGSPSGGGDMLARIYQPTKTAMQSGRANTKDWVIEFEQARPRQVEPLMGWTASTDMNQEVRLEFPTKEQAVAYAAAAGIPYQLIEPKTRQTKPKSYSDNFRYDRRIPWSH